MFGLTASAQTYSVSDLGPLVNLAGHTDSGPLAINSSGAVASMNVVGGVYHAMFYNGSWNELGTLGGTGSLAGGINDNGVIAGYSATGTGATNAFLWTPGGTGGVSSNPQMRSLGTLGGAVSEAFAVNNAGQATGYSDVPAPKGAVQHAFIYSNGSMVDIGKSLSVSVNSFGYGINSLGHIAGTGYDANYSAPRALFYNGTTMTDLGLLGGVGCSPLALNNLDTMVGYISSPTNDHAFRYSQGTLTDLGTLGGHYSYALAINNNDVIVGGAFVDSKDTLYHAFVWANGTMTDLNSLVDQSGTGWTLTEARAVNDSGQIAGVGLLGGQYHAFRLAPATTTIQPAHIQGLQVSGATAIIQFSTVSNQHYTVQSSSNLASGSWSDLQSNISGTGGVLSVTNPTAGPLSFYRVLSSP